MSRVDLQVAYKKILIPLDGSPLAELAAAHGADLARLCQAEMVFLRVASPEGAKEAADYLYQIENQERFQGIQVRAVVRYGSPSQVIPRSAQEYGVDLVVLSSHGRTGLSRQVFGSVAEAVVRAAPCPVTVLKSFPEGPGC